MSDVRFARFACDDRTGFELTIMQAPDGDFHIGLVPNRNDFQHEHGFDPLDDVDGKAYSGMWGASVRVRMPMIGGGSHSELWHALAGLWKALGKAGKLSENPRPGA